MLWETGGSKQCKHTNKQTIKQTVKRANKLTAKQTNVLTNAHRSNVVKNIQKLWEEMGVAQHDLH